MGISRKESNAKHYAKTKKFKSQRITRADKPRLSQTSSAVRKRRSRMVVKEPYSATLEHDGFRVYRQRWTKSENTGICHYLRQVCKEKKGSKDHHLRRDPHKLSFHIDLFHQAVKKKAIEVTNSLELPGKITEPNIACIVTHRGSTKQNDHVDTRDTGAYSVLHMMTNRTIWVGSTQYVVKARDVLVMKGGVCHAGAAHTKDHPTMMLHVPVGYKDILTSICK